MKWMQRWNVHFGYTRSILVIQKHAVVRSDNYFTSIWLVINWGWLEMIAAWSPFVRKSKPGQGRSIHCLMFSVGNINTFTLKRRLVDNLCLSSTVLKATLYSQHIIRNEKNVEVCRCLSFYNCLRNHGDTCPPTRVDSPWFAMLIWVTDYFQGLWRYNRYSSTLGLGFKPL